MQCLGAGAGFWDHSRLIKATPLSRLQVQPAHEDGGQRGLHICLLIPNSATRNFSHTSSGPTLTKRPTQT
ncbi:hypothetical protein CF319_g8101 [Tilletia indica]|nr:hypothetical protein CF319_g8101 [Tilletia indica]